MAQRSAPSLILSLAVFVPLAAATGCIVYSGGGVMWAAGQPAAHKETRTLTAAHAAGSAIDVETGNGSIDVRASEPADGAEVRIEADLAAQTVERLAETRVVAEADADGALRIRTEWPGGRRRQNERCSFRVVTPGAGGVLLVTSNGDLRLAGLSGAADLTTSNGAITVAGHDGPVAAASSNGDVTVRGVEQADVSTSNGDVRIALAAGSPGRVNASTSNGGIVLAVADSFRGEVDARTSNGRVSNEVSSAAAVGKVRKSAARYVFRGGGPVSTLETSNGSIQLERLATMPRL